MNKIRTSKWALLLLLCNGAHALGQLPSETPWANPHFSHDNYLSLSNPGYLQTVYDPNYNVNITRVTDEGVFGSSGAAIHHQYSEVQAWNADSSKYWIGFQHVLNDSDNSVYKTINLSMHDGRWSENDPNIRYFSNGNQFRKLNIVTEQVSTLHIFSGFGQINIGDYHGQVSQDEKVVITEEQFGGKAALYDIASDTVLHEFTMPKYDATLTRSGKYIQVHNSDGTASYYDWEAQLAAGNWVDGAPLTNPTLTLPQAHDNFAYDSNGDEVVINMGPLRMFRLSDGLQTDLLPATAETFDTCEHGTYNPYFGGHISTPNDLPGWAFISAVRDDCNNDPANGFYHNTEQFLVKLDGSGTIRPFGFSRSSYGFISDGVPLPGYGPNEVYFTNAKSAVRQDGRKATFTSDWYVADGVAGDIVQYVVESLAIGGSGLDGDFNGNNVVDAADYSVWLDNLGATEDGSALGGNGNGGIVDQSDYTLWKTNFGNTPANVVSDEVPEPTSCLLLMIGILVSNALRRQR